MPLFETVTDLHAQAAIVRRRRYGVIEFVDGRFRRILLRPFPKYVTLADSLFWGRYYHARVTGDRCRLFYNQPLWHSNFLALKYVLSTRDASLASLLGAAAMLDEIAQIKRSDAILTDAANLRISERLLRRLGWERHTKSRWHRNYIKRFYGEYPAGRYVSLSSTSAHLEAVSPNDQ